jgi:hypothetical protein
VGDRQFACPKAACQDKRQAVQQAAWRRRNPDYFTARRIREKGAVQRPEAPVLRSPLDRLPWDDAQTQFTTEGLEFIAGLGRLLVKHGQTLIRPQVCDTP